jgi:hypothetical protein
MHINRRQFLVKASAVTGWALSASMRAVGAEAEEVNRIPFAKPIFLMNYSGSKVSDYRPVLNGAAAGLIFERTIGTSTTLYSLDLTNPNATPQPFAPSLPYSARADWSWVTGQVAFSNTSGIYLADSSGGYLTLLNNTAGMIYPAWYPDAAHLAVYNNQAIPALDPVPRTSEIDLTGAVLRQVMANDKVWAGFPSVNQSNPNLIAFAGQVVEQGGTYNQNKNYIWLTDNSTSPPTVRTLAPNAPKGFNRKFQGRAPWYSPDGRWIAFESDRFKANGLYSIFIQKSDGSTPAVRVTNPLWNANHAKWYPKGTELVVTVLQYFGAKRRGIAKLEVSAFVG